MDSSLNDTLKSLIARMDHMDRRFQEFRDQANTNCRDLAIQLERLEADRRRPTEENESRNNSRSPAMSELNPTIQRIQIPGISKT